MSEIKRYESYGSLIDIETGERSDFDGIVISYSDHLSAIKAVKDEEFNAAIDVVLDVLVTWDIFDAQFSQIEKLKRKVGE
jgi:hypothetical protein